MSDKMREEFEARFPVPLGVEWQDGAYRMSKPDAKRRQITLAGHLFYLGRWETWKASRESLVIELPSEDDTRCDTVAEIAKQEAYNLALGECASAIEAAGLKVKS